MKKKTISGDMFIIPNPAEKWEAFPVFCQAGMSKKIEKNLGVTPKNSDHMVEIWCTSDTCDNWSCHGHKELCEITGESFPMYCPETLLKGVKEGDTVTIELEGVILNLTAKQTEYRYRNHGTFESVLSKVISFVDNNGRKG